MSQFKVPQNVQREDTIIGPLTLKQLIILGIGGGTAYSIYVTLARSYFIEVWLPPVAIIVILTLLFTFVKIHNMPFYKYVMNFLEYKLLEKKRIWIQGSDQPIAFSIMDENNNKKNKKDKEPQKEQKSIEELTKIVDTGGEVSKKEQKSKEEKREELQKIINQNYK